MVTCGIWGEGWCAPSFACRVLNCFDDRRLSKRDLSQEGTGREEELQGTIIASGVFVIDDRVRCYCVQMSANDICLGRGLAALIDYITRGAQRTSDI